ncbi:type II toxin-antitoxin system PemK/MazF family toxin [Lentilactobacillus buchneri]|uniref:Uncharacterized protein n=1 Tax=Lentilactobacillus buchneri DSM 20057 TaxID=1423728 RepID=A0A4R5NS47_LENBU|nr:type II toxin-antitoxin system PemK/MazF family toxin [Lentilactobacillus buchneri]WCJ51032.1 type II toxin-antitoxin system PemK/MazF family toxin [Lentilactobacillus sp. Egmn17]AEB74401.1 PemK family protein [Lentilactobacillus buchneri NRRL B-30929]MCT2883062.1 PemK family transcriptional regulator [Lentilactobacillus buchneri]MCT2897473.1 PemK family transcriptional regulator [Lentilactobacillus buchneri]MCT3252149.1 PemK family transcriptional regulator [Lentilactobacillus buchneri]
MSTSFPEQGDIIVLDFDPHTGHEMGGHTTSHLRRPAVVVSNAQYNRLTGFVVVMPITHGTSQIQKGFEPILDPSSRTNGYIVTWQTPNYDYVARNGAIIGQVPDKLRKRLCTLAVDIVAAN